MPKAASVRYTSSLYPARSLSRPRQSPLRGLPPFYSPKYDLKRHPNYKFTEEADKKRNAFDLDRLIRRRRRPGLDEACEVYQVDEPIPLTDEDEDILNYDDVDDPDAF